MNACAHRTEAWGSNFLGHAAEAERRMEAGEKQRKCPACKLWIWDSLYDERTHDMPDDELRTAAESALRLLREVWTIERNMKIGASEKPTQELERLAGHPLAWWAIRDRLADALESSAGREQGTR